MTTRLEQTMELRALPNWPPAWIWMGGDENKHPKGEVGLLRDVMLSALQPSSTCFLIIEHDTAMYMGRLLFDDPSFCSQIFTLLRDHCGRPIQHIGGLDFSRTP